MEQTLLDLVEAAKIALQERISERMYEQFGVIEVSKNSSQESVKIIPQKQMSQRKGERIGVIELPKISYQESVEVVKNYPSGANVCAEV